MQLNFLYHKLPLVHVQIYIKCSLYSHCSKFSAIETQNKTKPQSIFQKTDNRPLYTHIFVTKARLRSCLHTLNLSNTTECNLMLPATCTHRNLQNANILTAVYPSAAASLLSGRCIAMVMVWAVVWGCSRPFT